MVMNKKGVIVEEVIYVLLNIMFFGIMLFFIISQTNGKPVLEQAYAKEIAMLIDEASPRMTIFLEMQDAIEKAEGKGIERIIQEEKLVQIVKIDEKEKKVFVKLGGNRGYSFRYFNSAKISCNADNQGWCGFDRVYLKIEVE